MVIERIFLWGILLFYLLPIVIFGVVLLRRVSSLQRLELIIPGGIVLGLTVFTFILNTSFFILPGEKGIIFSYIILLFLLIALRLKIKNSQQIEFPGKSELFWWALSLGLWGGLIFWKGAHALIGGDVRGYYSVSSSFIKGNFPLLTPWQPEVPLSYHTGSFELLGAFHYLTDLSFEFLHIFFSCLFILCAVQIVIWIFGKSKSALEYLLFNLAAIAGFIFFGFFKVAYPVNLTISTEIHSINDLVIWLRNLPLPRNSIESYGVPTDLDSLIYVIFHSQGLAILFLLILLLLYPNKNNLRITIFVWIVSFVTLALVNESIFIPYIPVWLVGTYFLLNKELKVSLNPLSNLVVIVVITGVFVVFQGGVISANFLGGSGLEKSADIFPSMEVFKSQTLDYHLNTMRTRILPVKNEWLPFQWVSIGLEILIVLALLTGFIARISGRVRLFYLILFTTSISAIIAYNLIVPKYVMANSNRIIVLSYQLLAVLFVLNLIPLFTRLRSRYISYSLTLFLIWVLAFSILPPLAFMSTTRFGQNKLVPRIEKLNAEQLWIKSKVPVNEYITVLDGRSPHPSGVAELMNKTGVLSPLFVGGFRTYTIEPGPEYTDIVYTLSPVAIKKLKIRYLLYDSDYFRTLPKLKQKELNNSEYFQEVFFNGDENSFKKIVKVNQKYLDEGSDLGGSFDDINTTFPKNGKYYIDSEKNFEPDFIRRPLIFTLRGRDLVLAHESGVYQHTETPVLFTEYTDQKDFDYLVLSKKTDPKVFCDCDAELIWVGISDKVYLWRVLKS